MVLNDHTNTAFWTLHSPFASLLDETPEIDKDRATYNQLKPVGTRRKILRHGFSRAFVVSLRNSRSVEYDTEGKFEELVSEDSSTSLPGTDATSKKTTTSHITPNTRRSTGSVFEQDRYRGDNPMLRTSTKGNSEHHREHTSGQNILRRGWSGSFPLRQSHESDHARSRSHAEDLVSSLQLSEDRDTDLNKTARFQEPIKKSLSHEMATIKQGNLSTHIDQNQEALSLRDQFANATQLQTAMNNDYTQMDSQTGQPVDQGRRRGLRQGSSQSTSMEHENGSGMKFNRRSGNRRVLGSRSYQSLNYDNLVIQRTKNCGGLVIFEPTNKGSRLEPRVSYFGQRRDLSNKDATISGAFKMTSSLKKHTTKGHQVPSIYTQTKPKLRARAKAETFFVKHDGDMTFPLLLSVQSEHIDTTGAYSVKLYAQTKTQLDEYGQFYHIGSSARSDSASPSRTRNHSSGLVVFEPTKKGTFLERRVSYYGQRRDLSDKDATISAAWKMARSPEEHTRKDHQVPSVCTQTKPKLHARAKAETFLDNHDHDRRFPLLLSVQSEHTDTTTAISTYSVKVYAQTKTKRDEHGRFYHIGSSARSDSASSWTRNHSSGLVIFEPTNKGTFLEPRVSYFGQRRDLSDKVATSSAGSKIGPLEEHTTKDHQVPSHYNTQQGEHGQFYHIGPSARSDSASPSWSRNHSSGLVIFEPTNKGTFLEPRVSYSGQRRDLSDKATTSSAALEMAPSLEEHRTKDHQVPYLYKPLLDNHAQFYHIGSSARSDSASPSRTRNHSSGLVIFEPTKKGTFLEPSVSYYGQRRDLSDKDATISAAWKMARSPEEHKRKDHHVPSVYTQTKPKLQARAKAETFLDNYDRDRKFPLLLSVQSEHIDTTGAFSAHSVIPFAQTMAQLDEHGQLYHIGSSARRDSASPSRTRNHSSGLVIFEPTKKRTFLEPSVSYYGQRRDLSDKDATISAAWKMAPSLEEHTAKDHQVPCLDIQTKPKLHTRAKAETFLDNHDRDRKFPLLLSVQSEHIDTTGALSTHSVIPFAQTIAQLDEHGHFYHIGSSARSDSASPSWTRNHSSGQDELDWDTVPPARGASSPITIG